MQYQAVAKYIRGSTRRFRLVADAVKSLDPEKALVALQALPKRSSGPLADAIRSALANAKQKIGNINELRFSNIEVMQGPSMKRWNAVSRGQAHAFKKKMSHIRVILTDGAGESSVMSIKGGNQINT